MSNILIFGATSAIAQETARIFASRGDSLFLAGLFDEQLQAMSGDLITRGAGKVHYKEIDLIKTDEHAELINNIWETMNGIDTVLIAHGVLGDQEKCEKEFSETETVMRVNFISYISLLTFIANKFEAEQKGNIAVISSVAGDRGRKSNYVYGASKGALSIFMQGLRGRLADKGVTVTTIKPGFVDTPMTAEFKKGLLWSKPDSIARGIVKAIDKKKDIVYLPGFWYLIMLVIRHIPERIFKKLSI